MSLFASRHLAWPILSVGTIGLLALVSGRQTEHRQAESGTTETAARLAPTTLARLGAEVCAVVAAPCPTDLLFPIGPARHAGPGWGVSAGAPSSTRGRT